MITQSEKKLYFYRVKLKLIILLLFAVIFHLSCRKNKDEVAPVITIIKPYENQQYSTLDTVWVTATVDDETALKQIDVTLTDENKTPVLQTMSTLPNNKNYTFTIPYDINDIELSSGNYFIRVRATDGTNVHDTYRTIKIDAIPKVLKYVYILSFGNSTTIHALRKTSSGNPQQMFDINGDFSASAVSSKFQLFYTCGKTFGDMHAYNVSDETEAWSIPVISDPPFPYFENIGCYNDILYTSFYNGYIKGYNKNGSITFNATTPTGTYPQKVMVTSSYLFADHAEYSGSAKVFAVYYAVSGALKQQMTTNYGVLEMFEKDNDNIVLFGNQNGQAVMNIYKISDNGTWAPHTLPTGKLYDAIQLSEDHYILALASGLYYYDYSDNSLTSYLSDIATDIKFDSTTSELYASSGHNIRVYDYNSHTLINTITVADSILDFRFLYNR